MAKIKIYTTDYCPYCKAAKNLLEDKGLSYEEILIQSLDEKETLIAKTGQPTVPQIFIDDEFIGGFDELKNLEERGELDRKLGD